MSPLVCLATSPRSTSSSGLSARVDVQDALPALHVGRRDEDLAVEAPGRSSAGSSFSRRLEAAMTTTSSLVPKPSISTSSWLRVWSFSPVTSLPRAAADRVELVDEDDRRRVLARLAEQAPDAGCPEAGEHLHEGGRRLREEVRARLVGHGLGEQGLAGAGRAVQQDALRHPRAERLEPPRVAQELDDLRELVLGLVGAGHLVPAAGLLGGRA